MKEKKVRVLVQIHSFNWTPELKYGSLRSFSSIRYIVVFQWHRKYDYLIKMIYLHQIQLWAFQQFNLGEKPKRSMERRPAWLFWLLTCLTAAQIFKTRVTSSSIEKQEPNEFSETEIIAENQIVNEILWSLDDRGDLRQVDVPQNRSTMPKTDKWPGNCDKQRVPRSTGHQKFKLNSLNQTQNEVAMGTLRSGCIGTSHPVHTTCCHVYTTITLKRFLFNSIPFHTFHCWMQIWTYYWVPFIHSSDRTCACVAVPPPPYFRGLRRNIHRRAAVKKITFGKCRNLPNMAQPAQHVYILSIPSQIERSEMARM